MPTASRAIGNFFSFGTEIGWMRFQTKNGGQKNKRRSEDKQRGRKDLSLFDAKDSERSRIPLRLSENHGL